MSPRTSPSTARRAAAGALFTIFLGALVGASGCTRVLQDEVGVRRKFGKVQEKSLDPGLRWYNPFTSRIFKLKTRTVNIEIDQGLPSKEGLTVLSEISILYRMRSQMAPQLMRETGLNYESEVILPVFRSAAADVCARFFAKDMHSAFRRKIEEEIQTRMMEVLEERGFIIEAVLLKSIALPRGLSSAIEDKLQAEQLAQRMEFELQRENSEAQRTLISAEARRKAQLIDAEATRDARIVEAEGRRKIQMIDAEAGRDARLIEAEGIKVATMIQAEGEASANREISRSLTPAVLKYRAIEVYEGIIRSNNSKLIITDGKAVPLLNLSP